MASPLGDMKSGMKNPIKKNTFGTVSAMLPCRRREDFCPAPILKRWEKSEGPGFWPGPSD
jgi:hypothetical protein